LFNRRIGALCGNRNDCDVFAPLGEVPHQRSNAARQIGQPYKPASYLGEHSIYFCNDRSFLLDWKLIGILVFDDFQFNRF
jgi:hypothetical protein